jgi:Flp pilus assembly protein TadG
VRRGEGQALVEFTLVLPVFLLIVLIAVDFGRVLSTHIAISNAAREGAAFALEEPGDTTKITERVREEANVQSQGGEGALTVAVSCADAATSTAIACSAADIAPGSGARVTVAVSRPFGFITPLIGLFLGNSFSISASATAAVLGPIVVPGATPMPTDPVCPLVPAFTWTEPVRRTFNFRDESTGGATSWLWVFDDLADAIVQHPSHTYTNSKKRKVSLTIKNGWCERVVWHEIDP